MNKDNPYEFLGGAPEDTKSSAIGIFVYLENENDKINDESLIAVGQARELANMLGTGVGAILMASTSDELARQIFYAGADKVFLSKDDRFKKFNTEQYCHHIINLIEKHKPEIFLAGLSQNSVDFIPRLAQRLQTGLVSGCIALEIDTTNRILLATRPCYNGKMHEVLACESARPQIVLLMPSTFPLPIMDDLRQGEIEKI